MKHPKDMHDLVIYWTAAAIALGLAVVQILNLREVVPWLRDPGATVQSRVAVPTLQAADSPALQTT